MFLSVLLPDCFSASLCEVCRGIPRVGAIVDEWWAEDGLVPCGDEIEDPVAS
jgi:hypothetical protein